MLDNIIAIAKRKMDDANIVFYAEIDVTDIVIEQLDFIILLENLFDNAIESAVKCEKERKSVHILGFLELCPKPRQRTEFSGLSSSASRHAAKHGGR